MKKFSLKEYVKNNPHVWYVLLVPVYLALFFMVEKLVPSDCDYWVSYIPLDDRIPFLESFIIPYCMWYPLLFAVGIYLMVYDAPNFKRYILFIMIGFISALAFCLIVPNGQDLRPASFERENAFTWLIGRIYAADTNTNVFPSMHVIGSIGAAVATFKSDMLRRYRWPVLIVAILISMSTVLIKQHSILDVFGGIAWCLPLYAGIYGFKKKGQCVK